MPWQRIDSFCIHVFFSRLLSRTIIIGTRGSDLALWQTHYVQSLLEAAGVACTIRIIKTKGDREQDLSFDKMEGKGFFTKEIEEALLNNEIDLAVHSLKDLETNSPERLCIAAVSNRADASELLLIRPSCTDMNETWCIRQNAVVGTSSARRKAQLLHQRPDVKLHDIRGNVPTRINKLCAGEFDAILIAKAGVDRLQLDLGDLHSMVLPPREMVPAPAQGVLAMQCRTDDASLRTILQKFNDATSQQLAHIERTVLQRMHGGCRLPLGVHASIVDKEFVVHVAYASSWNAPLAKFEMRGNNAEALIEKILRALQA